MRLCKKKTLLGGVEVAPNLHSIRIFLHKEIFNFEIIIVSLGLFLGNERQKKTRGKTSVTSARIPSNVPSKKLRSLNIYSERKKI